MNASSYRDLPNYVPGKLMVDAESMKLDGFGFRKFSYSGLEIDVPPLAEYMVISYRSGATPVHRKVDASWRAEKCAARDLTLLTKSQRSEWYWSEPVEVSHIYISSPYLEAIANEAFEQSVADVHFKDILKAQDKDISQCMLRLEQAATTCAFGDNLIADAAARELCVLLLRKHSRVELQDDAKLGGLTYLQRKRVLEFLHENTGGPLSYKDAALEVGLGEWNISKRFHKSFGKTFHQFVMEVRAADARQEVERSSKPLKLIALDHGFADQSHMTRTFKTLFDRTPSCLRKEFLNR